MTEGMPEQVRQVYDPLWQAMGALHANWKLYRQVYGTSLERIGLLNEFAPAFFRAAQDALLESSYLAITRLTDSFEFGKNQNLCLEQLLNVVEKDVPGLPGSLGLRQKIEEIKKHCGRFIKIRHKQLAHNDLRHALGNRGEEDAEMTASREHVENALGTRKKLCLPWPASFEGDLHEPLL